MNPPNLQTPSEQAFCASYAFEDCTVHPPSRENYSPVSKTYEKQGSVDPNMHSEERALEWFVQSSIPIKLKSLLIVVFRLLLGGLYATAIDGKCYRIHAGGTGTVYGCQL